MRCSHPEIRCIHGDEIVARSGRRRACTVCGRALKGPLPFVCTVTGEPHMGDRPSDLQEEVS